MDKEEAIYRIAAAISNSTWEEWKDPHANGYFNSQRKAILMEAERVYAILPEITKAIKESQK